MYQKIFAKLAELHPGLHKGFLGFIAKQLEAKITEENQIEGAIAELDKQIPIKQAAEEFQKEGDRRVTDAKKVWELNPPKKPDPDPVKKVDPPDDTPAWAKALIAEVGELRKEKILGTMKQRAAEKLKDIPEFIWAKRLIPEKEEDLPGFIDDVTNDWNGFKKEQIEKGLMSATPPAGGGGEAKLTDKAVEADITEWADKGKPKEQK